MYNRYIPGSNGVYERRSVAEKPTTASPACDVVPVCTCNSNETDVCSKQPCAKAGSLFKGLDVGDLLLICIVILLFLDSEEDDMLPLLIAAAAFLFT